MKEYTEVTKDPPAGVQVTMDETNVHNWHIVLDGPDGSPYAVIIAIVT
jgi:ubiquitin-protein ligase